MEKLGPEARHIINVERARDPHSVDIEFDNEKREGWIIAKRLAEVGQEGGDDLYQLNSYRKLYAMMLAELEVARDNMVELEHRIEEESIGGRTSIEKTGERRHPEDSDSDSD